MATFLHEAHRNVYPAQAAEADRIDAAIREAESAIAAHRRMRPVYNTSTGRTVPTLSEIRGGYQAQIEEAMQRLQMALDMLDERDYSALAVESLMAEACGWLQPEGAA